MSRKFRVGWRLCLVLLLFLVAFLDFVLRLGLTGRARSIPARARWLRFWAANFLRILNLKVTFQGPLPSGGVVACNHLSYLDVLVLGSLRPLVFVSKSEVAGWPVVGRLTRCAGTLYIVRAQKSDVVRLADEMVKVVEAGVPLVLFLEGTSSDGSEVLPFRSSLLAPMAGNQWPASGAWIHYTLRDGSVADEICYWRDMTFAPHLLNILGKRGAEAFVSFGSPLPAGLDRKAMARELHSQVCRLKEAYRTSAPPPEPAGR